MAEDTKGPLFRTISRVDKKVSQNGLQQSNAYLVVGRRAKAAKIETKVGKHTFKATDITAYLKNGGTLERAATMANHSSTRMTQLYDGRSDDVSLDGVERIVI